MQKLEKRPLPIFSGLFSFLKDKTQKIETLQSYHDQILTMLSYMFRWECSALSYVNKCRLEILLLCEGVAAVWRDGDTVVVTNAEFLGEKISPIDGRLPDVLCITPDGNQRTFKDWRHNPDVAVVFNDPLSNPDLNIERFADILTENEISIKAVIKNSRCAPMITSTSRSNYKTLESVIEKIRSGAMAVLKLDPVSNLLNEQEKPYSVDFLSDPKNVELLQYLQKSHEDFRRRLYNIYGMATNGSDKLAQQSKDEINNGSKASLIVPRIRLEARRGDETCGAVKISTVLGFPCEVYLCDLIQSEYKEAMEEIPEEIPEEKTEVE